MDISTRSGRPVSRTILENTVVSKPKSRSKSRGRPPKPSKTPDRSRPRSKSKSRKSPSRTSVKAESDPKPSKKQEAKPSSKSKEYEDRIEPKKGRRETSPLSPTTEFKNEIIRNSVSRFEDITAEAVSSVKRSARLRSLAKKEELEEEVTTLLKENISEISTQKPKAPSTSWSDHGHAVAILFLILLLPAIPLSLQSSCSSIASCKAEVMNLPKTWRKYFAFEQSLGYLVFFLLQIMISTIPLGVRSNNVAGSVRDYHCSGLASVLMCCGGLSLLRHFYRVEFQEGVEKDILPFITSALLVAFVFSVILLIKGIYSPDSDASYRKPKNIILDFWYGIETNPRVISFDFKITFLRSSLVLCVLLNFIYLIKGYDMFGTNMPIPFALVCFMEIIYCLDFLIFESSYLTSHIINHEGTGYMTVMSAALFPFLSLTFTRLSFSGDRSDNFPLILIPGILLYIMGYVLLRVSNYKKAAFKRNPHSFNYSDLVIGSGESVKLLCGSVWGVVRHPNYLGCLFLWWGVTWVSVIGVGQLTWPLALASLSLTITFIYRVVRLESHLSSTYPLTYSRYSSRVNRVIVPYVV